MHKVKLGGGLYAARARALEPDRGAGTDDSEQPAEQLRNLRSTGTAWSCATRLARD